MKKSQNLERLAHLLRLEGRQFLSGSSAELDEAAALVGFYLSRVPRERRFWALAFVEATLDEVGSHLEGIDGVLEHWKHAERTPVPDARCLAAAIEFAGAEWTAIVIAASHWRASGEWVRGAAGHVHQELGVRALAVDFTTTVLHEAGAADEREWPDATRQKNPDKGGGAPGTLHDWSRQLGLFLPPFDIFGDGVRSIVQLRAAKRDVRRVDILVLQKHLGSWAP